MKAGWITTPIEEFARTSAGGTPAKSQKHFYDGGAIPWLLSGEVGQRDITVAQNFITEAGLKGSSAKVFPANSVLVAMYGATAGEVGILRIEAATNQAVCAVLPNERYVPEFLYYFLLFAKEQLVSQAVGNAQPNISQAKIRALPVPLPPLDVQKRIVAVLDEAFDGLSRARANAEANLSDARELFERRLAAYFGSANSEWRTCKLSDVTTKVGSGATPTGGAGSYKTEGISLIRSLNVHDRQFKPKDLAFLDERQADKLSNVEVAEGDVLLNITGASIARCCLAPPAYLPARVNQHVSIIRCNDTVLRPEYLMFMLTSEPYKTFLLKTGEDNGSTRQALTKALILDLQVSFPIDLAEQDEVITHLRASELETNDLGSAFESKITELDTLRQSLLQKAFSGELT